MSTEKRMAFCTRHEHNVCAKRFALYPCEVLVGRTREH